MSYAYRSSYQHLVGARVAEIKRATEQLEPLLPRLRAVRSARWARIAAGAVGIAAAGLMAAGSITDDAEAPTYALVGGGLAMLGTYALMRGLGGLRRFFARAGIGKMPALTGHLDSDLARLDAESPVRDVAAFADRTERLEAYSTALPLVAISLLAPLTLHFLVWVVIGGPHPFEARWCKDFSTWIRISLVVVGHAHLALAICATLFAKKMRRLDDELLGALPLAPEWGKALGIAVLVAALPGLLLIAIPPILAALTGIAFIPFMYVFLHRRLKTERATLHLARDATQVRVTDAMEAAAALEELAAEDADALAMAVRA